MQTVFSDNKKLFLIFLFLSFLFFGNAVLNDYSFDDSYVTVTNRPEKNTPYVPNNPMVAKGIKGIPKIWSSRYGHGKGTAYDYRPFVTTFSAIEFQLFGQAPHLSHFVSILMLAVSAFVFFKLLEKLLEKYDHAQLMAFLCSLLFIAHPVHTEVVDSIKSRDEMMSLLLGLLAMHQAVEYFEKKKWINLVLALVCMFFAYASKLNAVVFIVFIPLALYLFKGVSLKKASLFLFSLFGVYLMLKLVKHGLVTEKEVRVFYHFENPLYTEKLPFFEKILFSLKTFGFYVKMLVFPYPMRFYYGSDMFPLHSSGITIELVVGMVFLFLSGLFCLKTKNKAAIFGLLVFLMGITPFLNFFSPVAGIVAERLCYTASTGFFLFVTAVIFHFTKSKLPNSVRFLLAKPFYPVTAILLVALFYTWSRNAKWKDEITLFSNDAPFLERSAGANSLIADKYYILLRQNDPKYTSEELIQLCWKYYNLAVKADTTVYSAYNNAGVIAFNFFKEPAQALDYFRHAVAVKSDFAQAYENIGDCRSALGQFEEALKAYEKALSKDSLLLRSYFQAARLNYKFNKITEARQLMEKAEKKFPDEQGIKEQLAFLYTSSGDLRQGLKKYEEIYRLNPSESNLDSIIDLALRLKDEKTLIRYFKKTN